MAQWLAEAGKTMTQQQYANLTPLPAYAFPVYASPGTEPRARDIAGRCQRAYQFLCDALGFEAELNILVLGPEHWQAYTGSPMYGIPQTTDKQTVVVAGQNSELWAMIAPPLEDLSVAEALAMRATYGQADGSIDLATYMNLLPIHEVGHLFIDQTTDQFDFHLPRRWLVELFCNLCLHVYIALQEPKLLPYLETFPQTVVAGDCAHLPYQRLADFERLYAAMEPLNFVWYLSQLHMAAKRVYEAGGLELLPALYRFIVQAKEEISDGQLAATLHDDVHPIAAEVLTRWPNQ
jgi:hypothetical protein